MAGMVAACLRNFRRFIGGGGRITNAVVPAKTLVVISGTVIHGPEDA